MAASAAWPRRLSGSAESLGSSSFGCTKKNDVLPQVLKQAREDLGENAKNLPVKTPDMGKLDIRQVLDAEFAFA
jgi:hypothetical protein